MDRLEEIIKIAKTAGYLKRVKRTGWVRKGVQNAESVAEHSFRTALLCMFLTRNRKIDRERLVNMALIHYLGETATSDHRYEEGRKVIASEKAKQRMEEDVLKLIFKPLEDGKYYLDLWYEFCEQKTEESKLLKQIEKIEMALQAMEYNEIRQLSDSNIREFVENAERYVTDKELKKLLDAIIKAK